MHAGATVGIVCWCGMACPVTHHLDGRPTDSYLLVTSPQSIQARVTPSLLPRGAAEPGAVTQTRGIVLCLGTRS